MWLFTVGTALYLLSVLLGLSVRARCGSHCGDSALPAFRFAGFERESQVWLLLEAAVTQGSWLSAHQGRQWQIVGMSAPDDGDAWSG